MEQLLSGVKRHALANYEVDGWDEVVEAWDDDVIIEHMEGAKTVAAAIKNIAAVLKIRTDYAAEIASTAY